MFKLLGIFSIISTCFRGIKEAAEPTVSAEQWANKELYHQDIMNGVSAEQRMKNLKNGRYYIPKEIAQAYPVPHRETTGNKRIIIENCELHKEDVNQYGAYQAYKWVDQGKYNLNEEELKITHLQYEKKHLEMFALVSSLSPTERDRLEEVKKILASTPWDCRKTEAVQQWQRAHDAESRYR